ncbi:MAG: hypothetical protein NC324_02975 [Bacteroides sp.]|nr:hypothetical protein [Bacteroides sp.]
MQPYNATIPIYAESQEEVAVFQRTFYDFVDGKRGQGVAVSAKKLTQAIKMFKDNAYLDNFLKA